MLGNAASVALLVKFKSRPDMFLDRSSIFQLARLSLLRWHSIPGFTMAGQGRYHVNNKLVRSETPAIMSNIECGEVVERQRNLEGKPIAR